MYINFRKLADAGFVVNQNGAHGVEIHNANPAMPPAKLDLVRSVLDEAGMTAGQADGIMGDMIVSVELSQIFNALK